MLLMMMLKVSSALRLAFGKCSRRIPSRVDARTFPPGEISAFLLLVMNSSTYVVQRWCMFTTRLSLSVKPFSFPRRNTKLKREREREGGVKRVGRERENFVFVVVGVVLCGMPREGGKRGKKTLLSWNEEKETNYAIELLHFMKSPQKT